MPAPLQRPPTHARRCQPLLALSSEGQVTAEEAIMTVSLGARHRPAAPTPAGRCGERQSPPPGWPCPSAGPTVPDANPQMAAGGTPLSTLPAPGPKRSQPAFPVLLCW